jgi:hypothetical protein
MEGVVAQFGRAIGQCISAWLCLVVAQHAQIAFVLGQPAQLAITSFNLVQLSHCRHSFLPLLD